jgi:hypothetical protein
MGTNHLFGVLFQMILSKGPQFGQRIANKQVVSVYPGLDSEKSYQKYLPV